MQSEGFDRMLKRIEYLRQKLHLNSIRTLYKHTRTHRAYFYLAKIQKKGKQQIEVAWRIEAKSNK